MALRDFLPKGSVIVVAGGDWSAIVPFYSQRKALMVRNGLEDNAAYLDRAFRDLADEDVVALVLLGNQRHNNFIWWTARPRLSASDPNCLPPSTNRAGIYCSLRYHDRFKKKLKESITSGILTNEPVNRRPARRVRTSRSACCR